MSRKVAVFNTVPGLQAALRQLPKEVASELRDASEAIAADIASEAQSRAAGIGGAYKLVGPTIRAKRDRVPVLEIGGTKRIPGRRGARQTVGDLVFGAEFGGRGRSTTQQFFPHKGTIGYALYPTIRDREDEAMEKWSGALLKALEKI